MQHRCRHILSLTYAQLRVGRNVTAVIARTLRVLWKGQPQIVVYHIRVVAYEGVLELPIDIMGLVVMHAIELKIGALVVLQYLKTISHGHLLIMVVLPLALILIIGGTSLIITGSPLLVLPGSIIVVIVLIVIVLVIGVARCIIPLKPRGIILLVLIIAPVVLVYHARGLGVALVVVGRRKVGFLHIFAMIATLIAILLLLVLCVSGIRVGIRLVIIGVFGRGVLDRVVVIALIPPLLPLNPIAYLAVAAHRFFLLQILLCLIMELSIPIFYLVRRPILWLISTHFLLYK